MLIKYNQKFPKYLMKKGWRVSLLILHLNKAGFRSPHLSTFREIHSSNILSGCLSQFTLNDLNSLTSPLVFCFFFHVVPFNIKLSGTENIEVGNTYSSIREITKNVFFKLRTYSSARQKLDVRFWYMNSKFDP